MSANVSRGRRSLWVAALLLCAALPLTAQSTRRKPTPAKPAAKPPSAGALTRIEPQILCPSELGVGVKSERRFCDVLTGRDPAGGVLITIPPHRGPVTLSFDLHNRHTYSEELIKAKRAFREYTATIGVLSMDNTLVERAIIRSDVRTAADLFDRVRGGAGPGGVKAVAPAGVEPITMQLPEDIGEQVSILGEILKVRRPDGDDSFTAPGRPIATISQVVLELRPAAPKPVPKPTAKPAPRRRP